MRERRRPPHISAVAIGALRISTPYLAALDLRPPDQAKPHHRPAYRGQNGLPPRAIYTTLAKHGLFLAVTRDLRHSPNMRNREKVRQWQNQNPSDS